MQLVEQHVISKSDPRYAPFMLPPLLLRTSTMLGTPTTYFTRIMRQEPIPF